MDVRIQTMYRESEAQTLPWSPPYLQMSKEVPEVLLLNNLRWGRGLPAGQYEVEEITMNRKKRAWEMYLTSVQKTTNIDFKKKIISQIERNDWEFLAQDLEKINEQRMELAKQVLSEQKVDFHSKLSKKIVLLNKKITERYEENIKKIQFERDKEIRRINNITKNRYINRYEKRTIIDEFSDKLSDMYAFKVKLGYHRRNTSVVLCEDAYNKVKNSKIKERKFTPPNRSGQVKKHNCLREQFIDTNENEFDEYFRKLNLGFEFKDEQHKKSKESEIIQEDDLVQFKQDNLEQRSSDSDKHSENSHVEEYQEDLEEVEKKRQLFLQTFKQKCLEKREKEALTMHLSNVESSLLAKLLDLTSKEQQRLEEEKKILSMALIAQAEKWKREARQDGIRQKQKMREAIRVQILDEAFDRIGHDLEDEFQNLLRDSLMDTAILQVEENMRTKIYDIDRTEIPKIDEGYNQEELVTNLKEHINSKLNLHADEKDKSLSDLGEINEVIQDIYEEIISMALELDNLVLTLVEKGEKSSEIYLIKDKIKNLLFEESRQPALKQVKSQVENIYSEYKLHCEINDDIKQMDKLCDTVIEIADDLYQTGLGDISAEKLKDKVDTYQDSIVDEKLMNYLEKDSTFYIFKLLKMSHMLDESDEGQLINDSKQILKRAKKLCTNITKIASKIHYFMFKNEYEDIIEENEPPEVTELLSEGTSGSERLAKARKERLCEKLINKLTSKNKKDIKKEQIIQRDMGQFKIDVCQIKREAAEIIESIVDIWLQIDFMVGQLESSESIEINRENILATLKCIFEKLEDCFGDLNEFLGIKELCCLIEPDKCDEATQELLQNFRKKINTEVIVDEIMIAAAHLCNIKEERTIDFEQDLRFIQEPLKTDIATMVKESNMYVAIPKLMK